MAVAELPGAGRVPRCGAVCPAGRKNDGMGWGLAFGETVELVVSEIVTSAIQATCQLPLPGSIRLWLLSDGAQVLILVWDASPRRPVPSDDSAGEINESGRGLMLVDVMSDRWSWYPSWLI